MHYYDINLSKMEYTLKQIFKILDVSLQKVQSEFFMLNLRFLSSKIHPNFLELIYSYVIYIR